MTILILFIYLIFWIVIVPWAGQVRAFGSSRMWDQIAKLKELNPIIYNTVYEGVARKSNFPIEAHCEINENFYYEGLCEMYFLKICFSRTLEKFSTLEF